MFSEVRGCSEIPPADLETSIMPLMSGWYLQDTGTLSGTSRRQLKDVYGGTLINEQLNYVFEMSEQCRERFEIT